MSIFYFYFFPGQCAQAVTGSGSSQFKACDLLLAASMISFLTFTSVFQLMLVLQSSPFIRCLRPGASRVATCAAVATTANTSTKSPNSSTSTATNTPVTRFKGTGHRPEEEEATPATNSSLTRDDHHAAFITSRIPRSLVVR